MTDATGVNATAPPRAVMLTIGEIATRDGVSKPAVSRKVKQLVDKHGLSVERDAQGRVARVNVAEYDHLRGRFDDPSKAQAARRPAAADDVAPAPSESYDEALRQKTWTEAERSRLKLEEERGLLVRKTLVAEAVAKCGHDIFAVVRRLSNSVDDMAAAVGREGTHGLHVLVKAIIDRQCTEIADALERGATLDAMPVPVDEPEPIADLAQPSETKGEPPH